MSAGVLKRVFLIALVATTLPAAPLALAQQARIMGPAVDGQTMTGGNDGGTPLRVIPDDALQGRLVMSAFNPAGPQTAKVAGKTIGMAPAARVFSPNMQLLDVNAIAGQKLEVRYRLDLYGQLLTAWVMTDAEYKAWKSAH